MFKDENSYIYKKNKDKICWKVWNRDPFIGKKGCYRSYTKSKSTKHFPVVLHKRSKLWLSLYHKRNERRIGGTAWMPRRKHGKLPIEKENKNDK